MNKESLLLGGAQDTSARFHLEGGDPLLRGPNSLVLSRASVFPDYESSKGRIALNQGMPSVSSLAPKSCWVVVGTFNLQVRNKRCAEKGSEASGLTDGDNLGRKPQKVPNATEREAMVMSYQQIEQLIISLRTDTYLEGWPLSGEERRWVNELASVFAGGWQ